MNDSAYFRELMLRAPPCPDWFELPKPIVKDLWDIFGDERMKKVAYFGDLTEEEKNIYYKDKSRFESERDNMKKNRLIKWPSFYAREVLKAAGEDAINSEIKTT